jgi:GNAT superfamily N-acetyltransferase
MTLSITPVHHSDPEAVEAWARVASAVAEVDLPGFPKPNVQMTRLLLAHSMPGRRVEHYLAWRDGTAVGLLELNMSLLDNLSNMHIRLDVLPSVRRQGIGRAVLAFALDRARANDRTVLMTVTNWNRPETMALDEAGARFAESAGFTAALPEVMRRLQVSELDESLLDRLETRAGERSAGYRLVTWRGPSAEELLGDIAYLDSRMMSDAPMGDLEVEAEKIDADRIRQAEQVIAARERLTWHTGAVHEASGRLVAWTLISKEESVDWHAWQQITIVDPDHRGHRLGLLVKVANLRRFRADQPGVQVIDTFNAAENSYMIAINEEMGFQPRFAFQNWQLKI